jgi:hypothetical protein
MSFILKFCQKSSRAGSHGRFNRQNKTAKSMLIVMFFVFLKGTVSGDGG